MNYVYTSFTHEQMKKDWIKLQTAIASTTISAYNREGLKVLENFQPHIWEVENPIGNSIAKNWNKPELVQKAQERSTYYKGIIYKTEVRRNLSFFGKAPLPTMYRPLLTKGIIEKYNAKNILDPSVGWGGRLLGTLALEGTHYTGIEPFSKTYEGLCAMSEFLLVRERTTLYMAGAEDVLPSLKGGVYDMVITSPPYFDLEIYSHEETQSVKRFPTWDIWIEGFLDTIIRECIRCLKIDGVSCWSVKNMPKYKLKDEVFRIHKKYDYELIETFGMTSTPRNTGGKSIITEETFIFKKRDLQ